ncbi:MAG TPA: PIG-L family deacetylase [Vicinamibacterales bacterium]|jgi:LmbE family N-acetylglucosaminyl deacetylase|nr:PIG-L family deacetylase [Vicinamibacterales bacterium]
MANFFRSLAFILAVALVGGLAPRAQMRVVPIDDYQGHVALGLVLRHLANTGIYMMATAHPDDENNGLLVELSRGQGYRTTLATATRGNGGQNEIGPELFEPLGVLRTEELTALHRFDGVEQYFTRAVDFGYTIDIDENLKQWGRDEIIGDYVRLIRTIRPDVISAQSPTAIGPGQHANHALSAILSHEAYKVAGDPTKYPEQIQEGLRAWQPKKFYFAAGGPGGGAQANAAARTCRVELSLYDTLLGRSYAEIGSEARSMHKCQGMAQLLALPAPSNSAFQLAETTIPGEMNKDEKALFDGVDTNVAALAQFAGQRSPRELNDGLGTVQSNIQAAQKKFDTEGDAAALQPLLAGLRAARIVRGQLRSMQMDASGRDEIDFRLRQKEREFQQAALAAANLQVDALSDDGIVVPGQPVRVSVIVANNGSADVNVGQIKFDGFAESAPCVLELTTAAGGRGGPAPAGRGGAGRAGTPPPAGGAVSALRAGQIARCTAALTIPANARVTEPYWHRIAGSGRYVFDADAPFGLPFRPTPFYMQATLNFGNDEVIDGMPIQYRYDGPMLAGEKRGELLVVPAMSVRVSPGIALIPASPVAPVAPTPTAARGRAATPAPAAAQAGRGRGAAAAPARPVATLPEREIRVTVVNDTKGAAESAVKLELPDGWTSTPPEQAVKFVREDESRTVRFAVHAPATAKAGDYHVKASVTLNGATFNRGYEVIEYPHIRRAHIYDDADVDVKVLDVRTAPNLTVGYVMGSGDEVAGFIEQLGAKVEMLDADALAWGDLSRYKTIVLGVRAYERRDDLRANNMRLLEYVENGGTLLVQYNRAAVRDIDGPYPAQVSDNRVTDENAPVKVLLPDHPVFNTPNKIRDTVWDDWVQERGLNFLGDKDSRYRDLVEMTDSFANNPGDKRGALVEATYGKGRWMYIGLGLWRELPAGVNGSYQLLANLISLGSKP